MSWLQCVCGTFVIVTLNVCAAEPPTPVAAIPFPAAVRATPEVWENIDILGFTSDTKTVMIVV
jgi:hypothetical protein